jgi:hypothetical protein
VQKQTVSWKIGKGFENPTKLLDYGHEHYLKKETELPGDILVSIIRSLLPLPENSGVYPLNKSTAREIAIKAEHQLVVSYEWYDESLIFSLG